MYTETGQWKKSAPTKEQKRRPEGRRYERVAENVEIAAVIKLVHVSGLYRKTRGMREVIGDQLNNEYLARVKKRKRKGIVLEAVRHGYPSQRRSG